MLVDTLSMELRRESGLYSVENSFFLLLFSGGEVARFGVWILPERSPSENAVVAAAAVIVADSGKLEGFTVAGRRVCIYCIVMTCLWRFPILSSAPPTRPHARE